MYYELVAGILGAATTILVGRAAGGWYVESRRWRRFVDRVERQHRELADWGEANGWYVRDGTDLRMLEKAEWVAGLTGVPGDWTVRVGHEQRDERMKKWQFGTIMTRELPTGRMLLAGCWRDDEEGRSHQLFASLTTDGLFQPFTLDLMPGGKLHREGEPPVLDDGPELAELLTGFEAPARLRLLAGEILLFGPGWLSVEQARELADRLGELHARLPRRLRLGPMR